MLRAGYSLVAFGEPGEEKGLMAQRYANPPIPESVYEVRFSKSFAARELERLKDRLKRRYPAISEQRKIEVRVEPSGVSTHNPSSGYLMTAENGTDRVLIHQSAFGTTRLAPYQGWTNSSALQKKTSTR